MLAVERHIRDAIQAQGRIPFEQFMELALYSPHGGYYRSASPVGAAGDYYTSPTAHPLFGTLFAAQLRQMWDELGRPVPFTVLEPGAGSGVMARDIVEAARADFPEFAAAMRYVALDYAPAASTETPGAVQWVASDGLPVRGMMGCILANELFDAMPVHRFEVHDGKAREVYVTLDGDGFGEVLGDPSTETAAKLLAAVGPGLPDGYRGEVCPAAIEWASEAAGALERGFLLTIDYGGTSAELYAPERQGGTLRCHYRHVVTANPYVRVGAQDITAHVDFSLLQAAGEESGLSTLGYTVQRDFLRNLGADLYLDALAGRTRPQPSYGSGTLPRQERLANRMAMQSLVDSDGLGGFRVLAQGKDVPGAALWGFSPHNPRQDELAADLDLLRVPMLTPSHVPLLEGKYPHLAEPQGWATLSPGSED